MKNIAPARLPHALFSPDGGAHPVKLIKADQAARLLPGGTCAATEKGPRQAAEIRLVATGPDYTDLEVICGCGEVTRFRCWNTPSGEEKGAK